MAPSLKPIPLRGELDPEDYTIRFGDKFSTTDFDTPQPAEAVRSGHPHRPTILIAGAWYYPHELRREAPVIDWGWRARKT